MKYTAYIVIRIGKQQFVLYASDRYMVSRNEAEATRFNSIEEAMQEIDHYFGNVDQWTFETKLAW